MPFKSQAQRAYFYARHPKLAKRWEKETPKGKKLPKHVDEGDVEALVRPREEGIYDVKLLNPSQVARLKSMGFEQDGTTLKHPKHWRVSSGILLPKSKEARTWLSNKAQGKEDPEDFYKSPVAQHVPLSSVFKTKDPERQKANLKLVPDVDEAPHIDADVDAGGKHLHVVDLRIERYPISQDEKQRLMRAFSKTGLVGNLNGDLLYFKPDYSVDVIDATLARKLPMLPPGWDKIMRFVSEERARVPTMIDVFMKGK